MSSLAVVHDGNLSKNVDLVSCCPNMDLIALSMSDGTLAVNRWSFVWQQVFSSKKETTSSSRSTSLCWSPRGHVLAVGREDGTIDFYNCESVGKIRTLKAHDCAVTTMSWVVQNDRSDGYPDNTSSYIQRPPNLPKPKSFANFNTVPDSNEYKSDEKFPNRMDVLFSGTERGDFAAHAFGEFPCARLVLESDSVVKNIRVSNDLCIVNVLMENKDGEYDCVTLDSTFLWTYRRSIRVLAGHACEIEKMIDHVSKTFLEMRKNWQSGIRPLKDFLEAMSSTLIKYGRCDSPKEELLSLIASGPSDAALQLFGMPEHVTSHILKRMHKSCVGACESLISMIAKYLRPALEVSLDSNVPFKRESK
jgi:WD40 repeat protein